MKTKLKIKNIFIGFVFMISACVNKPFFAIVDSPCSPPCWQNIIPGETTYEEMIQIVDKLPSVSKNGSMGNYRKPYSEIYAITFSDWQTAYIYIIEENVVAIIISDNLNITVKEALSMYGEPESMYIHRFQTGDIIGLQYNLLYPDIGLILSVHDEGLAIGPITIDPDDYIYEIYYLIPEEFVTFMNGFEIFNDPLVDFEFLSWEGYEVINFPPK
jgi:hypothetical protein